MAWGATLATPAIASATDATSYSTASWTPTANRLILVAIGYSVTAGTAVAPTTLLGNGITYTNVIDAIGGGSGLSFYVGLSGAAPTAGAITASFGIVTQNGCEIHVIEIDGAVISGTALGAIRQSVATLSASVATPWDAFFTSLTVLGSSRCFTAFRALGLNTATTPRTGWTELGDAGHGTPNASLETQWSNTIADQQMTIAGWAGNTFFRHVGVEVLAATSETPISFTTPTSMRSRRWASAARRKRIVEVVSVPTTVVNPAITFSSTQHRIVSGWLRRTRISKPPDTSPIPPTTDCSLLLADGVSYLLLADGSSHLSLVCGSYPPQFQRHRVLYPPRRHRPPITTVYPTTTPPVNPTFIFNRPRPRTVLGFIRRSRPIQTTPPQFNPPIVFAPSQRRIIRAFFRKPRRVEAPLTQAAAPNPTIIFSPSQRRVIRPYLRRSKTPVPVRDQVNPPFPIFPVTQRRVQRNFPRRGKVFSPVPPQVIIPPPAIVFRSARHPVLALRGILARRGKVTRQFLTQNVPPDLAPAIVILDLQTSGVVSMTITTSADVTLTLAVSATVSMTLSSLNYKDS